LPFLFHQNNCVPLPKIIIADRSFKKQVLLF